MILTHAFTNLRSEHIVRFYILRRFMSNDYILTEDLKFASYKRRSDDVIVLHLQDDLMIDVEKAELMNAALTKVTGGIPRKILVLNGKYTSADSEARIMLSSHQKKLQVERVAVTIHSLSQKILANFFMKVNKPPFPIRFFANAQEAEKWLLEN